MSAETPLSLSVQCPVIELNLQTIPGNGMQERKLWTLTKLLALHAHPGVSNPANNFNLWEHQNTRSQDKELSVRFMASCTLLYYIHTFRREQLMTRFFTPANRMDVWGISINPEVIALRIAIKMQSHSVSLYLWAGEFWLSHVVTHKNTHKMLLLDLDFYLRSGFIFPHLHLPLSTLLLLHFKLLVIKLASATAVPSYCTQSTSCAATSWMKSSRTYVHPSSIPWNVLKKHKSISACQYLVSLRA